MNPKIVFPSEYHSHYMIPTQPKVGYYQPQSILHRVPDEALSGLQDDFLAGENIERVGNLTLPWGQSVDLLAAVCQSLSICGSLKEVPIGGSPGLPWTQTYQGKNSNLGQVVCHLYLKSMPEFGAHVFVLFLFLST